jgi:hypothetical protein
MAAAMLILLAAVRVPSVKAFIRPEATILGHHLQNLLKGWADISGDDISPSIQRAIGWIEIADRLIRDEVGGGVLAGIMPPRESN